MELWELVRRLLGSATGAQSFSPALVIRQYKREVEARGAEFHIESSDLDAVAEEVADLMKAAGLITAASQKSTNRILDAFVKTDLGDQLHSWLGRQNVVMFFQSMQAEIDRGEIQRLIHQLES